MTFAFPLAFVGLLAVPALLAIYWLRSRHRRQPVSTLLLWMDQREAQEGGLLIHRLQTPLLFFLELLTILLLILAAAGPRTAAGDASKSLIIVLDDSFSMLAGGVDSSRSRALSAIERELRGGAYSVARFVTAGETPQILGEASGPSDLTPLTQWRCLAPSANLEEAISFAYALGGNRARVMVVTDRAPNEQPKDGRLEWRAFGAARANVAFVTATRTTRDEQDRCLLEVANLSPSAAHTTLVIEETADSREVERSALDLAPNELRRITLKLRSGAGPLRARLDDDALAIDNQIVLLPETQRRARVDLRFNSDELKTLVEKAVSSTGSALMSGERPELIISDQDQTGSESPEAWILQIVADADAESYVGPFVVDRAHPLTEGLSLDGVVWGAGKSTSSATTPIITAGSIPLLTDVERPGGKHELRLHFRPDLSTLQESPNWPILIWNLIDWRASSAPGLKQVNLRLGSDAALIVPSGVQSVEVRGPDDRSHELAPHDRTLTIKAENAGVHEITAGKERYAFAANALKQEESDLTRCASGHWGDWESTGLQAEQRNVSWMFLLMALVVMAIHLSLTAGGAKVRPK